jgi:hypothetical protein
MDVRFEDHAAFQRAAGWFVAGGAALGAIGSLPLAASGASLALTLAAGPERWRPRMVVAAGCAVAALAWALEPRGWPAPVCGAMLALLLATVRADHAKLLGTLAPAVGPVALTASISALALWMASATLPQLSTALATAVPSWIAAAAAGGTLGLWAALSATPLHLRFGGDPIEVRLGALQGSLDAEVRTLAERAVAARRGAALELPAAARSELRALIDSLTRAALDLARRAAELGRASAPAVEQELQRRSSELGTSAEAVDDADARQSYLRAAEALSAQLEHFRRVRRARERILARLHEQVVNLERARFSLTLLRGPDRAAELDLLHERLRHGVTVFEEA